MSPSQHTHPKQIVLAPQTDRTSSEAQCFWMLHSCSAATPAPPHVSGDFQFLARFSLDVWIVMCLFFLDRQMLTVLI